MKEPWVVFRLGDQRYCTEAVQIREIITYRPAYPVPGAPAGVEGIITVREDKITLFSGAQLIQNAAPADREPGHIILLQDSDCLYGVSVDDVDGIQELDPENIDPSSVTRDSAVLGTIPVDQQLLTAVSLLTFCRNAIAAQGGDLLPI